MNQELSKEWDKIHSQYIASYDDWLKPYEDIIMKNREAKIIELGCGRAYASCYLMSQGLKNILACDFSEVVIKKLEEEQPHLKTMLFDMVDGLPFEDNSVDIIIADLCLQYFNEKQTKQLIFEIYRVLKPQGYLIGRVNSTKDIEHGANDGEKIERNFYFVNQMYKRFFEESDFKKFFSEFKQVDLKEEKMERYVKPKILWTFFYQKNNET